MQQSTKDSLEETTTIDGDLSRKILRKLDHLEDRIEDIYSILNGQKRENNRNQETLEDPAVHDLPQMEVTRSKSTSHAFLKKERNKSLPRKSSSLYQDQSDRPDIIFAFADVFGEEDALKNFVPFKPNAITNPNKMFKNIVKAATSNPKKSSDL